VLPAPAVTGSATVPQCVGFPVPTEFTSVGRVFTHINGV